MAHLDVLNSALSIILEAVSIVRQTLRHFMIYLDDLRNATGGQLFGEAVTDRFTGFCHDVQLVKPGSLYVALRTEAGDGHQLIEQALAAGAAGILCHDPPTCDVSRTTVILVGDTAVALGQWAAYVLRQYGTMVIGVAGSLGKSSTCEAVSAVLGMRYSVFQSQQSRPGQLGLLLNLGALTSNHQVAVIELKGRYPGEMAQLLALLRPQMAVITAISPVWNRYGWGSVDTVKQETRQIVEALPDQGTAVLNADDGQVLELLQFIRAGRVTYGQQAADRPPTADILASAVGLYLDRTVFDLAYARQTRKGCWLPVLARPNLSAALAALSVGLLCDIPLEEGLQALSGVRPLPGRLGLLDGVRGLLLADDTFDATPAAARAALEWLAAVDMGGREKLLILGDLTAEGEEGVQAHMEIGPEIARSADFLIACGDMACVAGRAARRAGMASERVLLLYDQAAIPPAVTRLVSSPGDLVLVAGGRQARMESTVQQLLKNPADRAWLARQDSRASDVGWPDPGWPSWIELNLQAVAHNVQEFRRRLSSGMAVMAVVAADAYGHGAVQIASAALNSGVSMLGVASLGEGVALRRAGIEAPILVLGQVPHQGMARAIAHNLIASIHDGEAMRALAYVARGLGRTVKAHLCVDAGTGGVGVPLEQVVVLVRELVRLEVLDLDGLYMHGGLAKDGIDSADERDRLGRFTSLYTGLHASGLTIPCIHVDGTIAATMPESYFTMARIGPALVGIDPLAGTSYSLNLQTVLTWKTVIAQVKTLPGEKRIAFIPVGYADGFRSSKGSPAEILIKGRRVPVVGRPETNCSMIYVPPLTEIQVGDEAVLLGRQGSSQIAASDIARRLGDSALEVLCSISSRIPRVTG